MGLMPERTAKQMMHGSAEATGSDGLIVPVRVGGLIFLYLTHVSRGRFCSSPSLNRTPTEIETNELLFRQDGNANCPVVRTIVGGCLV